MGWLSCRTGAKAPSSIRQGAYPPDESSAVLLEIPSAAHWIDMPSYCVYSTNRDIAKNTNEASDASTSDVRVFCMAVIIWSPLLVSLGFLGGAAWTAIFNERRLQSDIDNLRIVENNITNLVAELLLIRSEIRPFPNNSHIYSENHRTPLQK